MKNSGQCNYCGKTYTKSGILKHIKSCKERQAILHKNDNGLVKNYFHLKIDAKYNPSYWLYIYIREDASLAILDRFLRDIWVECCGHLSCFNINGEQYDSCVSDDYRWNENRYEYFFKDCFV